LGRKQRCATILPKGGVQILNPGTSVSRLDPLSLTRGTRLRFVSSLCFPPPCAIKRLDKMDELDLLANTLQSGHQRNDLELDLIPDPSLTGTAREELLEALHEHEASGFRITVRQKYAVHGAYVDGDNSQPASLLVLQFELRSTVANQHRRFRHLDVCLQFITDPEQTPAHDPFIKCFAPAQKGIICLLPTAVLQKQESTLRAGLDAEHPPLKVNLSREKKKAEEWEQIRRVTISASATKTQQRGGGRLGEDKVQWILTENEKQKAIPDTFALGVVVRRSGNSKFKVIFDLKAKVDFWYGTEVVWQKAKDKVSFSGVRESSKVFDPSIQGPAPNNEVAKNLKSLVEGDELDKLVFVHLPEEFTPVLFYSDSLSSPSSQSF
jgi:hypothetical protein